MKKIYKSRVFLDKDNIIHWDVEPEKPPEQEKAMQAIINKVIELAEETPGKAKVIVDFRRAARPTPKTRKIITNTLKAGFFKKIAIWGTSIFIKTITEFIISASGVKFVKFFDTEKKAIKWLLKK